MKKKIVGMMLCLVMLFSISTTTYAKQAETKPLLENTSSSHALVITRNQNGDITYSDEKGIEARIPGIPNAVEVGIYDDGGSYYHIAIQNFGLDWVDEVSLNVLVYNRYGLQYNTTHREYTIKQFYPRIIYGSCYDWTTIVVTNIVGRDEGDVAYIADVAYSR